MPIDSSAISLYSGKAPGSEEWTGTEREWRLPPPVEVPMLWNVVDPTLTPVLPDAPARTGTAIIVCPGGGYFTLAIGHEGFDVARELAARGVTAFVLKYRVMPTADTDEARMQALMGTTISGPDNTLSRMDQFADIPRADARAALNIVRNQASEWAIDPGRIGMLGFSAGARLVLDVATQPEATLLPAFAGAIYGPKSPYPVSADAPALFLAVAEDDRLVDHVLETHAAWREAGRPVEAHLYGRAGHGFGMRKLGLPSDTWLDRFCDWMLSLEFNGTGAAAA